MEKWSLGPFSILKGGGGSRRLMRLAVCSQSERLDGVPPAGPLLSKYVLKEPSGKTWSRDSLHMCGLCILCSCDLKAPFQLFQELRPACL